MFITNNLLHYTVLSVLLFGVVPACPALKPVFNRLRLFTIQSINHESIQTLVLIFYNFSQD